MSRPILFSFGLLASIALYPSHALAQPAPPSAAPVSLVLNGTIKNFDEFAVLVVSETFLQLVPLPADGKYGFTTDDQSRFSYSSDLPKLPVPKKPPFSFTIPNIPSGRYFLAAQRLKSQGMTAGHQPHFITDRDNKKQLFLVVIPADAKSPFAIDAGNLILWTH